MLRNNVNIGAQVKQPILKAMEQAAAEAYGQIVTRYPVTERAEEAKQRLAGLRRPVPTPTAEAIAQNKAEEESRRRTGMRSRLWETFSRRPDTATTARVGEPTLVDPKPTNAPEIVRESMDVASGKKTGFGAHSVSVETTGTGTPPPNEPAPRSDAPAAGPAETGVPELTPLTTSSAPAQNSAPADNGPAQPFHQLNQAAPGDGSQASPATPASDTATSNAAESETQSSSKQKKKKGLRKLVPF